MQHRVYQEMAAIEDDHWWFRAKKSYIDALFRRLPGKPGRSILDIGCATGGITSYLRRYGVVNAIERDEYATGMARKRGVSVTLGDAHALPYRPESFDVVTLFDVLYHRDIRPETVLSEALRVLKSGGYLIITDCAHPWLWSEHDRVMHARCRFTVQSLTEDIEQSGFVMRWWSYLYSSTFLPFAASRILSKFRYTGQSIPSERMNTFLTKILSLEARVLRFGKLPFGSSIAMIAQK